MLKEQQRDKLFALIKKGKLEPDDIDVGFRLHISSPEELSGKMLRM